MDYALLSGEPCAVAGVRPIFRRFDESGSYGIPVDVLELFCEFGARDDVDPDMGGSGRASLDTHPNDDKTVVRMGHPVSWAPITLISRHAAVVPRLLFGEAFFDGLGYVFDGGVLGELADFGVVGFFVEAHLGGDVTIHA